MNLVVQWRTTTHEVFLCMEKKKGTSFRSPSKALCLGDGRRRRSKVSDTDPPFSVDGRRKRHLYSRGNSTPASRKVIDISSHLRQLLRNGELEKGLVFLDTTIYGGIVPDVDACSDLIWGFVQVRQAAKAQEAMDIIEGAGLSPDVNYYTHPVVVPYIYDQWFKLNVIHDVDAAKVRVYVNGTLKIEANGRGRASHAFKFGVYSSYGSSFYMESHWRDVKILKKM